MHFLHGLWVSIKSLFCQKLNLHCINSISLCLQPISIHSVKPCSWRQGLWMTIRVRISSTPRVINFYIISANIEPRISEERKHFFVFGWFFFGGGYKIIFHSAKLMWCILYITTICITMILFKRNMQFINIISMS